MTDKRSDPDYQRNVEDFVRNNVVCCVSSLFSDVAKLVQNASRDVLQGTSFDDDEMTDLTQRADWETPAREHIDSMDRDDLVSALDEAGVEDDRDDAVIAAALDAVTDLMEHDAEGDDGTDFPGLNTEQLREMLIDAIESAPEAPDWEDFGRAHDLDPKYDEVYEHHIVDRWFAARLKEHGEITGDFGGLTVRGRTTTGQAISMDYVVCQIYDELHQHREDQAK